MVSKIVKSLNSINDLSKKIIIYASVVSLALCLLGTGVIIYNALGMETISLHKIGASLIYTSITLFVELIVGSLIIDLINAFISNKNE